MKSLNSTGNKLIALVVASVVALLVAFFVSLDVLTRVGGIEWRFNQQSVTTVSHSLDHRSRLKQIELKWIEKTAQAGSYVVLGFKFDDIPVTRFSVRFTGDDQSWPLRTVIIYGYYGEPLVLQSTDIPQYFTPANPHTRYEVKDGIATLVTSGDVAELVGPSSFRFQNSTIQYLLPVLTGIVVYILMLRWKPGRVPSLRLANHQNYSNLVYSPELDGLRGLAAISVVADHTWGIFSGMGLSGVWIFFALSGYLLSIPFVKQPNRIFSLQYVSNFYVRRLARIVPMYYTALFIYYVASGHIQLSIPHFLFLQGDDHLWTIPQEMLFYLLLPAVMLGMAALMKFSSKIALLVLAITTIVFLAFYNLTSLTLHSNGYPRPPYLGWFLVGVAVSYLVNSQSFASWLDRSTSLSRSLVGWIAAIGLFAGFMLASIHYAGIFFDSTASMALSAKRWYAILAGFLVFAAVYARDTVYGAILRNPIFRSFGILGFSVYLIHPLLLDVILEFGIIYTGKMLPGPWLFAATMALSWLVASLTFNFIEYPFLVKKPRRQDLQQAGKVD